MNDWQYRNEMFGNFINLASFGLGFQNLIENRSQSQYNDVHAANDAQAKYLLAEIDKRFREQNKLLLEQNEILEKQNVMMARIIKALEGEADGFDML